MLFLGRQKGGKRNHFFFSPGTSPLVCFLFSVGTNTSKFKSVFVKKSLRWETPDYRMVNCKPRILKQNPVCLPDFVVLTARHQPVQQLLEFNTKECTQLILEGIILHRTKKNPNICQKKSFQSKNLHTWKCNKWIKTNKKLFVLRWI